MNDRPTDLVISGQVLVRIDGGTPRGAEAVAIREGRIVGVGRRRDLLAAAAPATRVVDEPGRAVIPGLHDFHLHLVGMARLRSEVRLDGLQGEELVIAVRATAADLPHGAWLRGRGWSESALTLGTRRALEEALEGRPALLYSHDAHSAWASDAALGLASIRPETDDPGGGRLERDEHGGPTGVLRERATDLVEAVAGRLRGPQLEAALDETLAELAGWGVTGVTDAGDTSAENGTGPYAALGDRASLLLAAAPRLDGRLRVTAGFPADAIEAATELGLASGRPLAESGTLRAGWAKVYADGALGSRTAATFAPYTCGAGDRGILRLTPADLDGRLRAGRRGGIGLAVHAIGDRAAAAVLDAMARAPRRAAGVPADRIEHLQLLRPEDQARLAQLDVTASVQPVHCAADRAMVDECWADRAPLAYPWRALVERNTRLAFGSDAPIETPNPWLGLFAAVHRRHSGDGTADWQAHQALTIEEALGGYTIGPAAALGRSDEGHLEPGARADLAVLNVDLATLLAGDERLSGVRSVLTLVGGREVHRA